MDNQRLFPQAGSDEATSAMNGGKVRRETRDPVIATNLRMERNSSSVPCKVPRFQYADFPSLHQCIKRLSVPKLEDWLATSPLGKASSPKETAPKFTYVDYPSLYRCIQQLSVPPLETWSSELTKPSREGSGTDTGGVQGPSRAVREREKNKETKENRVSASTRRVPDLERAVRQHVKDTQSSRVSEKDASSHRVSDMQQMHSGLSPDWVSSSAPGSKQDLDRATERNERSLRPSVISLVRKHGAPPAERQKGGKPAQI